MSEQQYDIIFRGDIVLGHQLADVKLRLQHLFKADAAKVDSLFSGRPVPLKRGLDLSSAQKYREALINAGVQIELVASVDASATAPVIIKPEARAAITATPVVSAAANKTPEQPSLVQVQTSLTQTQVRETFSLAPVGTDLLPLGEKPEFVPRPINTSALSIRSEGGNLLDASEQKQNVAQVIAPDFTLAEVGSDLIRAEEKSTIPLVEFGVGDWEIAEVGADMINADEREINPLPVINIPSVELAPAGANLGQIKPVIKPVVPDISKLHLAD
ncbi:MAG: hypothetical protein V4660_17440 [Pseudomonadota bacterium]